MVLLPDFFQRIYARLIGLRLPIGKVAGLLVHIPFGDDFGEVCFHRDIVRHMPQPCR